MKHGKKFFVGGLINLAAGLGTAGYGAYQERQAKKKMAQADAMAEGPIRSQAARQRIAKQESDAQSAIDSALRAQATAAGRSRARLRRRRPSRAPAPPRAAHGARSCCDCTCAHPRRRSSCCCARASASSPPTTARRARR